MTIMEPVVHLLMIHTMIPITVVNHKSAKLMPLKIHMLLIHMPIHTLIHMLILMVTTITVTTITTQLRSKKIKNKER